MRRLLLGALITAGLIWPAVPARADTAPGPATSAASPDVTLLSQTPWLEGKGDFHLHVALPGAAPGDRVQVTVFYQLITRTAFDRAAEGQVQEGYFYRRAAPLAAVGPDRSGGYDLVLPVNHAAAAGAPFPMVQIGETGVFPVQVQVVSPGGAPVGDPLTTFSVFAVQTDSAGAVKPLTAAFIVPVSAPPEVSATGGVAPPSPAETARLADLAQVLNSDSSVPADILASPLTLDALAAGGGTAGRATLAQYAAATVGGPFEVLPAPYSPVPLGALESSLPGEVGPQLAAGAGTLKAVFQVAPDQGTWVVDGPLDPSTLDVLVAHRARQVIVPNADLAALPGEMQITFAGATYLDYGGTRIRVVGADSTLTGAFPGTEPPVLAANRLLAEVAMIYTEAPNAISPRGLALLPPAGWSASPVFVQTVLQGLSHNPLVTAVTASGLFSALGPPSSNRQPAAGQTPGPALPDTARIAADRARVDDLSRVLGHSPQLGDIERELLLAETPALTPRQRSAVLAAIEKGTAQVRHAVALPPATSITLTSTQGQIPLTILSAANLHPRIQLELRSQRLIFRPFSPREGRCRVMTDTREICILSLSGQNTTLNVPVETRSSGVFPVDVWLEVPGTGKALAHDEDTVRSTAVSGVALVVIGVALLGLILWWGRDLRRGRRPKGMVPAPLADTPEGPDPQGGGAIDIDGFFDRPPPDYGEASVTPMSPSGAPTGPRPTSDGYGPTRETREL